MIKGGRIVPCFQGGCHNKGAQSLGKIHKLFFLNSQQFRELLKGKMYHLDVVHVVLSLRFDSECRVYVEGVNV